MAQEELPPFLASVFSVLLTNNLRGRRGKFEGGNQKSDDLSKKFKTCFSPPELSGARGL